jgi:signal peptidase II
MHGLIICLLVAVDQVTKVLSQRFLMTAAPIVLIENFLQLNYLENRGASFGILQEQRMFFIVLTTVIIIGIIWYRLNNNRLTRLSKITLDFVMAGALGNYIDRIRLGYVIDMIDVNFWGWYDFPIFNFADIWIVCGTFFLAGLIMLDKQEMDG